MNMESMENMEHLRLATGGAELTADYTRRVEEIRSMQRKINREAREE